MPLPTENLTGKVKKRFMERKLPRKFENAFTKQKRRSQSRKGVYRAKTRFPDENVARKAENAFIDAKRRSQWRKRPYRIPSERKVKTRSLNNLVDKMRNA